VESRHRPRGREYLSEFALTRPFDDHEKWRAIEKTVELIVSIELQKIDAGVSCLCRYQNGSRGSVDDSFHESISLASEPLQIEHITHEGFGRLRGQRGVYSVRRPGREHKEVLKVH
jgi:hypothetical protein